MSIENIIWSAQRPAWETNSISTHLDKKKKQFKNFGSIFLDVTFHNKWWFWILNQKYHENPQYNLKNDDIYTSVPSSWNGATKHARYVIPNVGKMKPRRYCRDKI